MATSKGTSGYLQQEEDKEEFYSGTQIDSSDSEQRIAYGYREHQLRGHYPHELDSNVEKALKLGFQPFIKVTLSKYETYLDKEHVINKNS